MSISYKAGETGLTVTVTDKDGKMNAVTHNYEKAMEPKQFVGALQKALKSAPSVRQAAISFIHHIQETGMLKPWFSGDKNGKVAKDLLSKMRELEDTIGKELGLTDDMLKELRQPGQYADTRSLALKCWAIGVPLKQATEKSTGLPQLVTTAAMRQIVQAHRSEPEATTLTDLLEKVEKYIEKNPGEAIAAIGAMNRISALARSFLDSASKEAVARAEAGPALAADSGEKQPVGLKEAMEA